VGGDALGQLAQLERHDLCKLFEADFAVVVEVSLLDGVREDADVDFGELLSGQRVT